MVDWLRTVDSLEVSLRYGVYDSPHPDVFARTSLLDPNDRKSARNFDNSNRSHAHVSLGEELKKGATGQAHPGALYFCDAERKHITMKVVAKLGFSSEQRKQLENEYSIYRRLAEKDVQGVPFAFGLFQSIDDNSGGPYLLLLSYGGKHVPTSEMTEQRRCVMV